MWLSRSWGCSLVAVLCSCSGAITSCLWPLLCPAPKVLLPYLSSCLQLLTMGVGVKHPKDVFAAVLLQNLPSQWSRSLVSKSASS